MKHKSRTTQMQFRLQEEACGYIPVNEEFFLWGASAELCNTYFNEKGQIMAQWHKIPRRKSLQVQSQQLSIECCCFTRVTQSCEGSNQQSDCPWRLLMESFIWTCAASVVPRLNQLLWFTPSSRWVLVFSERFEMKQKSIKVRDIPHIFVSRT